MSFGAMAHALDERSQLFHTPDGLSRRDRQPYHIRQLRRALEHVVRHRDRIWLTRPGEICAHIECLPTGTVPGSDDS